ncbi:hypothetical protein C9374_004487 [Naegleria lovaniensis]|uniref:Uncharacterized protein n=1 Tax=Naegleria lovaniensis TaxID=51637 RepID=A0AA88KL16_NAELO|nr:uncharacterized protein C9374_004487 [Naegleria lovaniensis]KAG2383150.1 hypothetical protein C9374_004487 [Naegleria lovaniensis]
MGSALFKFSCSKVSDSNVHDHCRDNKPRKKVEKTIRTSSTPSSLSFRVKPSNKDINSSSTPALMNLCPSVPTLNDVTNAENASSGSKSTNGSPRRSNRIVPLTSSELQPPRQPESSPLQATLSFRTPSLIATSKLKTKASSFVDMKKHVDLLSPIVNIDPTTQPSNTMKYDDSSYFDNYNTLSPKPIDQAVLQKVMTRNPSAGNVLRESLEVFRFGAVQQYIDNEEDLPMDDDEIKSVETVSTTSSSTVEVEIFNHSASKGLLKTKSSYRLERTGSGIKKPQLSSFHRYHTVSDIHRALVEEHQMKALSKHSSVASIKSKHGQKQRDSLDSQGTTSSGTGTSGSGSLVRSPTPRIGKNKRVDAKVNGKEALLFSHTIPEERHLVASMSLNNLFSNKTNSSTTTKILGPVSKADQERKLLRNFSSNQIITSSLVTKEKHLSQSSQDLLRDLKKSSTPKALKKTSSFKSTTSNTSTVSKDEILNRVFNTAPSRPTLPSIKRKKKESRLIIDPKTGSIKYTDEEDLSSEKSSLYTTRSDFSSLTPSDETRTNYGNSDIVINIQEPKEAPEIIPKSAPNVTLRQLKLQKIQKLKEQKETEEMIIAYIMDEKYSDAEINNYLGLSIGSHEFMDIF